MKSIYSALISTLAIAAVAIAQNESPSSLPNEPSPVLTSAPSTGIYWPHFDQYSHLRNRSIAFGTAQLLAAGKDIHEFKSIQAYSECHIGIPNNGKIEIEESIGSPRPNLASNEPIPEPTIMPTTFPSPLPTLSPMPCRWLVYITTGYNFKECPNGMAFIERSGYGQVVKSVDEGEHFEWKEEFSCEWVSALKMTEREAIYSSQRELVLDKIEIDRN